MYYIIYGAAGAVDREFVYIDFFLVLLSSFFLSLSSFFFFPEMGKSGANTHQSGAKMRQSGAKTRHLGPSRRHLEPSWLPKASPDHPKISFGAQRLPRANIAFFEHPKVGCTQGDFCKTSDFEHPTIACTQGDFCKLEKNSEKNLSQVL